MSEQDILDLDAIEAKTIPVVIAGQRYEILTGESLPVAAALDAARLSRVPAAEQTDAVLSFIGRWCKIPREVLDTLSMPQLDALFKRILPPAREVAGSADPQRTAIGTDGRVLGAPPCKLP